MDSKIDALLYVLHDPVTLTNRRQVSRVAFVAALKMLDALFEAKQDETTAILFEFVLACHDRKHVVARSGHLQQVQAQGCPIRPGDVMQYLWTNQYILGVDRKGRMLIADGVRLAVCVLASIKENEIHLHPYQDVIASS